MDTTYSSPSDLLTSWNRSFIRRYTPKSQQTWWTTVFIVHDEQKYIDAFILTTKCVAKQHELMRQKDCTWHLEGKVRTDKYNWAPSMPYMRPTPTLSSSSSSSSSTMSSIFDVLIKIIPLQLYRWMTCALSCTRTWRLLSKNHATPTSQRSQ